MSYVIKKRDQQEKRIKKGEPLKNSRWEADGGY